MEPPVALLAYAADDPARAAFWPFAVFSPEWQAIRTRCAARRAGARSATCRAGASARAGSESGGRRPDGAAVGRSARRRWRARGRVRRPRALVGGRRSSRRRDGAAPFDGDRRGDGRGARGPTTADADPTARRGARRTCARCCGRRPQGRLRADRGGLRRLARARADRPLPPATADAALLNGLPKAKVALHLGAVDARPAGRRERVRRRHHLAGLVPPPVHRARPAGRPAGCRASRACCAREDLPVSTAHVIEAVRLAERWPRCAGGRWPGWPRSTEATRAVLCDGDDVCRSSWSHEQLVVGERLGRVPDDDADGAAGARPGRAAARLRLQARGRSSASSTSTCASRTT